MSKIKMSKEKILEKIKCTLKFEESGFNKIQEKILLGVDKKTGEKIKPIELSRKDKEEILTIIYKHLNFENYEKEIIKWFENDGFWNEFSNDGNNNSYVEVVNKSGRIKFIGDIYIINDQKIILISKIKKDEVYYCFI